MAEHTTLTVSVVTPEGSAYEGRAAHVVVPAFDGEMAFYPMHAPLVGVLGYGELRITRVDGVTEHFCLAGGVVQIAQDEVSILAESVEPARSVDGADAARRLEEARTAPATGTLALDLRQARTDEARARIRVAARSAERNEPTAAQILDEPIE